MKKFRKIIKKFGQLVVLVIEVITAGCTSTTAQPSNKLIRTLITNTTAK